MPYVANVTVGTGSDSLLELLATTIENGSGASVWRARQTPSGGPWAEGWRRLGEPGRGDAGSLPLIQQCRSGRVEAL